MNLHSLDSETHLISPGNAAPKLVCGSHAVEKAPGELLYPHEYLDLLEQLLTNHERLLFAQAPFDLSVAIRERPRLLPLIFEAYERGDVHDVLVRQALIDIGRGCLFRDVKTNKPFERYSLAGCVEQNLGEHLEKANTWRLRYGELDGIKHELWPEEAQEYPKKDATYPIKVYYAQEQGGQDDPGVRNLALEKYENRANWALGLMRVWGIRTDPAMVKVVVEEVTAAHNASLREFTESGIYRPDGTKNMKRLRELVSRAYQGAPPVTPAGNVNTDRDTLLESEDPLLVKLGKAGTYEKDYSTYLTVIRQGAEYPINPETNILVKTGRTSYRNPNLQNLPRNGKARECFVPRSGYVYCSTDYPSLEMCTLAQVLLWMFNRSELAETLYRKEDPHCKLGAKFESTDYASFKSLYKSGDARAKLIRQACKPVNFGMGGGMGAESLVLYARQPANGGIRFCLAAGASKCGVDKILGTMGKATGKPLCARCVEIAARFRESWFETYPEMRDYFDRVKYEIDSGGGRALINVMVPAGEPELWCGDKSFGDAANLRFQGLAARLAKDALWCVSKACYTDRSSALYGTRPVIYIHDEIFSEVPEANANDAGIEQARLMGVSAKHWIPDVPCVPEAALSRRWFKGAEPVFDREKKLVPWWPRIWEWAPDQEIMRSDREKAGIYS